MANLRNPPPPRLLLPPLRVGLLSVEDGVWGPGCIVFFCL